MRLFRFGSLSVGHFLLLCAVTVAPAYCQKPTATEYEVKAAFLFNFAKFVEWPPGTFTGNSSPLRVCVLGAEETGAAMEKIVQGKTANGRQLRIERLNGLDQVKGCELLFVGASKSGEAEKFLYPDLGYGILTVGESDGFALAGGMINLVTRENHIAFEINLDAAQRAGLKISSKLLNLAMLVRDERAPQKD